ncbi:hypothetical protein A9Q86_07710 [Flavobacteriales bacterium 33_180_T64]|nr:hypothetical protein A9Q86_07710 [Flavobacteriales bacterium 33_180_T64]
MIKPNVFIIGAQKSATTSLYNWLSQHPNVCGPSSIKDYPFFITCWDNFDEESKMLDKEYLDSGYSNQKIVLHGSVQYMFEEKAIDRIFEFDPNAKLICTLRDPTERAISAHKYFKKLNLETKSLKQALDLDEEFLNGTLQQRHDFTYKSHGLYAKQLEYVFKKFNKDQVLVFLYEDIRDNPVDVIEKAHNFLEIDDSFSPELIHANATGEIKFKLFQKLIFNNNKFKKFIVDNIVDPFIPLHKRSKIRWALSEWNTKSPNHVIKKDEYEEERVLLKKYFKEDILKLEQIIKRNLDSWKE